MRRLFTILLVEDDPADAYLLQMALAETGISATMVHQPDGLAALAWLEQELAAGGSGAGPDLILLDLNMPRMDGREFLQRLKADPDLCHLPVVVCSTSGAPHDLLHAYRGFASGYIVKPLDIDSLQQKLQEVVSYWMSTVNSPTGWERPPC